MEQKSSFMTGLRKLAKKAVAFVALSAFTGVGALTASATAGTAQFNGLPDDYANLQVTKAGAPWTNATSINAEPGDTINLLLWDHNSGFDNGPTALNVVAKINVPTTVVPNHTVTSTLSADNAASVFGSVNVSSSVASKLEYIPGSAKFYRNVNDQLTEVNFPAGVNKDDIVTTGVNLGNQEACWHFSQAVMIQVKVSGGNPAITTHKEVALSGTGTWGTTATAQPGDAVAFNIYVENTGTAVGVRPTITDTLDSHLAYIPGTSIVRTKVNNQDVDTTIPENQITKNGQTLTWTFDNMNPVPDAALFLIFQTRVAAAGQFSVGSTNLQNCAVTAFQGGPSANTNCVTITIVRNPVIGFTLDKEVMNLSATNGQWYENVGATPGQTVAFRLKMINTGDSAASNVTLKDILPAGLTLVPNTAKLFNAVTGTAGVSIDGNALIGNGYLFSSVGSGTPNTQIVIFNATVGAACAQVSYTNTAVVLYQGAEKARDTASVDVTCNPGLNIVKDILDPSDNVFKDQIGFVREGQILTYRIKVQNTGNVTAVHPILRDVMPTGVTYVQNSLSIDGLTLSQTNQTQFLDPNTGLLLTDFTPGMSKYIVFQVKVADCPQLGDTVIINKAFVRANGIAEISDTAKATIHVVKPTLTF